MTREGAGTPELLAIRHQARRWYALFTAASDSLNARTLRSAGIDDPHEGEPRRSLWIVVFLNPREPGENAPQLKDKLVAISARSRTLFLGTGQEDARLWTPISASTPAPGIEVSLLLSNACSRPETELRELTHALSRVNANPSEYWVVSSQFGPEKLGGLASKVFRNVDEMWNGLERATTDARGATACASSSAGCGSSSPSSLYMRGDDGVADMDTEPERPRHRLSEGAPLRRTASDGDFDGLTRSS